MAEAFFFSSLSLSISLFVKCGKLCPNPNIHTDILGIPFVRVHYGKVKPITTPSAWAIIIVLAVAIAAAVVVIVVAI